MKNFDVGQTIQVLANIGVIAGIVFLSVEVSQSNDFMSAQARSERFGLRLASLQMAMQPAFSEVWTKHTNQSVPLSKAGFDAGFV